MNLKNVHFIFCFYSKVIKLFFPLLPEEVKQILDRTFCLALTLELNYVVLFIEICKYLIKNTIKHMKLLYRYKLGHYQVAAYLTVKKIAIRNIFYLYTNTSKSASTTPKKINKRAGGHI